MVPTRIARRNRLQAVAARGCLIAAVVLLTAGVGPCESQESTEERRGIRPETQQVAVAPPTQQGSGSGQQFDNKTPSSSDPSARPAVAMQPCPECNLAAEKRKEDREISDLAAQWSVAWSTQDMATISWWSTGIAIVGLFGIGWTVWETRRNAKAAIVAAQA